MNQHEWTAEQIMTGTLIYVYATGRDDGLRFAVGSCPPNGPANGSLALFEHAADARLFAETKAAANGSLLSILPSAESGS